jgi:hypothetical protein
LRELRGACLHHAIARARPPCARAVIDTDDAPRAALFWSRLRAGEPTGSSRAPWRETSGALARPSEPSTGRGGRGGRRCRTTCRTPQPRYSRPPPCPSSQVRLVRPDAALSLNPAPRAHGTRLTGSSCLSVPVWRLYASAHIPRWTLRRAACRPHECCSTRFQRDSSTATHPRAGLPRKAPHATQPASFSAQPKTFQK